MTAIAAPPGRSSVAGNRVTIERMNEVELRDLARRLLDESLSLDDFVAQIRSAPSGSVADLGADLGNVQLDLDRARRCGFPEVVYGDGKDVDTIARVFRRLIEAGQDALATRVDEAKAAALASSFPEAIYNRLGRTFRLPATQTGSETQDEIGRVAVVTAGTSDRPVAEEACETLRWMRVGVTLVQDVGVAGPHRLPERLSEIADADAVVVVAGMEGALPSVVGGFVDCPVVGAPTSSGYGMSLGGVAALLSMLNSCAANVAVVNIDAGFKAGYLAGMIARSKSKPDHYSN